MEFNTIYHVYNHANARDNMFNDPANYDRFIQCCKVHIWPVAEIISYCLMPNHFHLVIKVRNEADVRLAIKRKNEANSIRVRGKGIRLKPLITMSPEDFVIKSFSNCFNAYAKYFNIRNDRRGSLFLKSFKRKLVNDKNYLRQLYLYIHMNPVKHGFRKEVGKWRYCSYSNVFHDKVDWISHQFSSFAFDGLDDYVRSHLIFQKGISDDEDLLDLPTNFKMFSRKF